MNKNIYFFIFCLIGSMQSQALFQGFSWVFVKKDLLGISLIFGSLAKKISDFSTDSLSIPNHTRNSFLAKPMNSSLAEPMNSSKVTKERDLAKNRTKKDCEHKIKHNPALDELLSFSSKYGHKEYWSDEHNTGQTKLYNDASKLNPKIQIDFSKVDFSACSKGPKVEKFKNQSAVNFAFPQIEKFAVKKAFNPEKTFDASDYTDQSRPSAKAENYF